MAVRNRPGRRQPDVDRGGELSERFMCRVRQVVVKVYGVFGLKFEGVATTRPQGQSRAPHPSTEQQ